MLYVALFFKTDHVFHFYAPNTKYVTSFLLRQDYDFIKGLDCCTVYRSNYQPFVRYYFDDNTGVLRRFYYEHK